MINISILGCGWLGTRLAQYLKDQNFKVKGSCQSSTALSELSRIGVNGSIIRIDTSLTASVIDKDFFSCDLLIVSLKPVRKGNDNKLFLNQINIVFELLKQFKIKQLIFLSSTSVYGNTFQIVNEDSGLFPDHNSGKALKQAEEILLNQSHFTTTVLRLGGLIGYNRAPIEVLQKKRKTGSLFVPVNLVHTDDVILIIHALIKKQITHEVFNLVCDKHPLRVQYYQQAFTALGLVYDSFKHHNDNTFKIVDNSKIKKYLDYQFRLKNPCDIYNYKNLVSI